MRYGYLKKIEIQKKDRCLNTCYLYNRNACLNDFDCGPNFNLNEGKTHFGYCNTAFFSDFLSIFGTCGNFCKY